MSETQFRRITNRSRTVQEKLEAAKKYLGQSWVLHPAYDPKKHPNHSLRRPTVLRATFEAARADNRI